MQKSIARYDSSGNNKKKHLEMPLAITFRCKVLTPRPLVTMVFILVVSFACIVDAASSSSQQQQQQAEVGADGSVSSGIGSNLEQGGEDKMLPSHQKLCHAWAVPECTWEPNLKPMAVTLAGGYQEIFYAYYTPDVSTFYNATPGTMKLIPPSFTGMFGKFINLSPNAVRVYWDGDGVSKTKKEKPVYITDIEPFGSSGTATYVGHEFIVTPANSNEPGPILTRWRMVKDNSLYYFDPFRSEWETTSKKLSSAQLPLYHVQLLNKYFATQYRKETGRDWLALYQQKQPPRYHMWRADFLGQTHTITTDEIYFVTRPDETDLKRGASAYGPRPDERQRMRNYRDVEPELNLTLTVLSCAPRVFQIPKFLSDYEVEHLLRIGKKLNLERSSTQASQGAQVTQDDETRTSRNSWIPRHTDLVTDAIYRRAADLLQMDEALLRYRRNLEIPEFPESKISIAERLQLVHYSPGQQYTPHHDFTMPGMVHFQPSRFITLLLYLNGGDGDNATVPLVGGETSFPRWQNAKTSQPLKVKPVKGQAVLFYNLLPDGNYDDYSQHAALPVIQGEKWLANLWIWDPLLDHTVSTPI